MHEEGKFRDQPRHLKDTGHMGEASADSSRTQHSASSCFQEKNTKRDAMQRRFADDVRSRCSTEFALSFLSLQLSSDIWVTATLGDRLST